MGTIINKLDLDQLLELMPKIKKERFETEKAPQKDWVAGDSITC